MSDAVVRQALREVQKHGQERALLLALLRSQAHESAIVWRDPEAASEHAVVIESQDPAGDWLTVEQSPTEDFEEAHDVGDPEVVAVPFDRVFDLILSLARFIPAEAPTGSSP